MTAATLLATPAGARPETAPRVLVIDDSAVARAIMTRAIAATGRWQVAAAVSTAAAALQFLADEQVSIILLDVNLPGVDGITAMPDLLAAAPGAKVVVVSSAAAAVRALMLGAVGILAKPGPSDYTSHFTRRLVEALDRAIDAASPPGAPVTLPPPVLTPVLAPTLAPAAVSSQPANGTTDFDAVAIGASTGGIHALGTLLRQVPLACRAPMLVTQHLPAGFMPHFAAQLTVLSGRPCEVAVDRLRITPGRIIVAPGDAHMIVVPLGGGGMAVRLSKAPAASGCLPSADPMLASLAEVQRERLLAIILSGMGRDGSEGAQMVRAAGGYVVAQDSATSVVWGMPGAVVAIGAADAVMPPDAIGQVVATLRRPA